MTDVRAQTILEQTGWTVTISPKYNLFVIITLPGNSSPDYQTMISPVSSSLAERFCDVATAYLHMTEKEGWAPVASQKRTEEAFRTTLSALLQEM